MYIFRHYYRVLLKVGLKGRDFFFLIQIFNGRLQITNIVILCIYTVKLNDIVGDLNAHYPHIFLTEVGKLYFEKSPRSQV